MKILNLFSGKEFVISDDEAAGIVAVKSQEKKAFIELRCGSFVDTAAIESLTDVPLIAFAQSGHPMNPDGRSFTRDGHRVYVEDLSTLRYLPDPKYAGLAEGMLKLKGKND